MSFIELILLSVALAMDCFTISIVSGVFLKSFRWKIILQISLLFGIFQAAMPLIGWTSTCYFSQYIKAFDHWIAFGLLTFLGGRMIWESFSETEETHFNPTRIKTQLSLAVATSIDALAVGISFSCLDYDNLQALLFPLVIIGAGSFLFSLTGCILGITLGKRITKLLRPDLLGGIILIVIGIKVLISHLIEA